MVNTQCKCVNVNIVQTDSLWTCQYITAYNCHIIKIYELFKISFWNEENSNLLWLPDAGLTAFILTVQLTAENLPRSLL